MDTPPVHSFHIPVLGLAFSIDTPLRVARYGISSVISIVDDILIEKMRAHCCSLYSETFIPISTRESDARARRITAYLNLIHKIVQRQIAEMRSSPFDRGGELAKYFELLADGSALKTKYQKMIRTIDPRAKLSLQEELRSGVVPGSIDVNIMTKLDKINVGSNGEILPRQYSDAVAALRGFVRSDLESSVVLSAGMNPGLYAYLASCTEFLPVSPGILKKKVNLKVSDFRSALIQGKFLAKKGIWISEYRIESGLNCGGHAFPTEGLLLGPILEEFKLKKESLVSELFVMYRRALEEKGASAPAGPMPTRVTVQGGIGTFREDAFLRSYYGIDGTGWGSPFLLVPEATNVDADTRSRLAAGGPEAYYISDASPLGVPFNNLRTSTSEETRVRRILEGRPGSPCTKKFLVSNTEFTQQPICTASREYQSLKIAQLENQGLPPEELEKNIAGVMEKVCLCEDLAASAPGTGKNQRAVAVCPGPNLAYFTKNASLEEMVGHIYGRVQLLLNQDRSNMFVNELRLYAEYLKKEIGRRIDSAGVKERLDLSAFRANMLEGIAYYRSLLPRLVEESEQYRERMRLELLEVEEWLMSTAVQLIPQEA